MAWSPEVAVLSATVVAIETCCHNAIQQGRLEADLNESTKRRGNNPDGVRKTSHVLIWLLPKMANAPAQSPSSPDAIAHRAGLGLLKASKVMPLRQLHLRIRRGPSLRPRRGSRHDVRVLASGFGGVINGQALGRVRRWRALTAVHVRRAHITEFNLPLMISHTHC